MAESYDIVLDSQLGERRGTLTIESFDGGVLYLRHELSTLMSTLKCRSVIRLAGEALTGTVEAGGAVMKLRGTKRS